MKLKLTLALLLLALPIQATWRIAQETGRYGTTQTSLNAPSGITGDSFYLYVADSGNNRILRLDQDLRVIDQFQRLPDRLFNLDHPTGLALLNRQLLVTDTHNNRIITYTYEGVYLKSSGQLGISAGDYDHPQGITLDAYGRRYSCDTGNHRVQVFDSTGVFLFEFGQWGSEKERLYFPKDVVVLPDQSIVVADESDTKLKCYTPYGVFQKAFSTAPEAQNLVGPQALFLNTDGTLWVADKPGRALLQFQTSGDYLQTVAIPGEPSDLFGWGSVLFVTDSLNNKVLKLINQ
ncbi:MAG: NHL repeat-containing protein [Candidatus Margulisiibacteriota bacterium]